MSSLFASGGQRVGFSPQLSPPARRQAVPASCFRSLCGVVECEFPDWGAKMGVEIETITAGDGENNRFCPTALCYIFFSTVFLHAPCLLPPPLSNPFFSPGRTFPKKGQRVVVHYVGEWGRLEPLNGAECRSFSAGRLFSSCSPLNT